jgi:hypothetical protein
MTQQSYESAVDHRLRVDTVGLQEDLRTGRPGPGCRRRSRPRDGQTWLLCAGAGCNQSARRCKARAVS